MRKERSRRLRWPIGPGFLVAAAFIGPGTVTTAALAGVRYGMTLLWVVALSTVAAIVLQEMAGRIGLVRRAPLGSVLANHVHPRPLRWLLLTLVFVAILFGNTAYQSGNLLGAAKGLEILIPTAVLDGWPAAAPAWAVTALALSASALLISGNPRMLRHVLTTLVVLMSLLFLAVAWKAAFSTERLWQGLSPRLPSDSMTTVLALFGTTIVPYNLFLYASLVLTKWPERDSLAGAVSASRWDIALAVGLGGVVTAAIVVVGSAAGPASELDFAALPEAMHHTLPPAAGRMLLGCGLFAAGLTSAVTAPLAAAYAAAGIFQWKDTSQRSPAFRCVWATVLGLGWLAAVAWQGSPQEAIVLAQAANGLILPVLAILLWWLSSRPDLMGPYAGSLWQRLVSLAIVLAVSLTWLISLLW